MGTPDFAVPTLVELAGGGGEIAAVYTRAPKSAGRGMAARRSPVHEAAERLRLPVLHPATLKGEAAAEAFRAHQADVAVVVAYGLLLPQPILEAPKFGCLNIHASLLPRWRGAAPIARAIMAGDAETAAGRRRRARAHRRDVVPARGELDQRRHGEIRRAHEDETKRHVRPFGGLLL